MQKITIKQMPIDLHIGCYEEERAKLQTLHLDIAMEFSMSMPSRSDDVSHTIDYTLVIEGIRQFVREQEWRLVEKLSRDVGEMLLGRFELLQVVTVHVTKKIPAPCDGIVCSFTSKR